METSIRALPGHGLFLHVKGTLRMSRAWLIGAGPGDIELMTLKAARALAAADVILVDDLVNPEFLQFARADANILHVGKRGGRASTPQAEIIDTMLAHLRAGRSVARLKGGDPFIFGRGGEELLALQAAGIPTEIVNGITAGIAAPAALGIPVTHRGLAQGAIFVTGHSAGENEPDWRALAATGLTLVIYMGVRRLDDIVAELLGAGMAKDTPCAAIESATLPTQRHVLAPLEALPHEVCRMGLGSPAIVIIGKVAALARSPAAHEHADVSGTCEPCALLASPGDTLVAAQHTLDGVTVAIAAEPAAMIARACQPDA